GVRRSLHDLAKIARQKVCQAGATHLTIECKNTVRKYFAVCVVSPMCQIDTECQLMASSNDAEVIARLIRGGFEWPETHTCRERPGNGNFHMFRIVAVKVDAHFGCVEEFSRGAIDRRSIHGQAE